MKRCPQCEFIYPDSDAVCDFDQAFLMSVAESEVAAITNTPVRPELIEPPTTHSKNFEKRKSPKALPIAAALGLVLGIVVVGVYFAVHRQMTAQKVEQSSVVTPQPVAQDSSPSPSPLPSVNESPLPEEVIDRTSKSTSSSSKTSTAHTTNTLGPVTTSENPAKKSGQKVILLTSGGKVEADEVWRTKDGVWYRRDGLVTLLKKNRVKAIVGQ